jgi:protein subunit release factor B
MSTSSIHTFNPFNLQHGSSKEWHKKLQEVIYYGASRSRQAAADINKADQRHHRWMQQCLQEELVSIKLVRFLTCFIACTGLYHGLHWHGYHDGPGC